MAFLDYQSFWDEFDYDNRRPLEIVLCQKCQTWATGYDFRTQSEYTSWIYKYDISVCTSCIRKTIDGHLLCMRGLRLPKKYTVKDSYYSSKTNQPPWYTSWETFMRTNQKNHHVRLIYK